MIPIPPAAIRLADRLAAETSTTMPGPKGEPGRRQQLVDRPDVARLSFMSIELVVTGHPAMASSSLHRHYPASTVV
jgi:hypothetical protein